MKLALGIIGFLAFVAVLILGARYVGMQAQPKPATPVASAGPLKNLHGADDDDSGGNDDSNDGAAAGSGAQPAENKPVALPALFVVRDGKELALAGPRKKPMLLHLWASWCGPCRQELPSLLEYGRKGDVEVVAVSVDDYWEPVVKFFSGKIPPEVAWDSKITLERALGTNDTIPVTFLVDTKGFVVGRFDGAHEWSDPELRKAVAEDLKP